SAVFLSCHLADEGVFLSGLYVVFHIGLIVPDGVYISACIVYFCLCNAHSLEIGRLWLFLYAGYDYRVLILLKFGYGRYGAPVLIIPRIMEKNIRYIDYIKFFQGLRPALSYSLELLNGTVQPEHLFRLLPFFD